MILSSCRNSFSQTTKPLNKSLQVRWTSNNGPLHVGSSPSSKKKIILSGRNHTTGIWRKKHVQSTNNSLLWAVVCFSNTCLWFDCLWNYPQMSSKPHISSSSTHPYINPPILSLEFYKHQPSHPWGKPALLVSQVCFFQRTWLPKEQP